MHNEDTNKSLLSDKDIAQADILESAVDQLAEIIYETIRVRATGEACLAAMRPSTPSTHA